MHKYGPFIAVDKNTAKVICRSVRTNTYSSVKGSTFQCKGISRQNFNHAFKFDLILLIYFEKNITMTFNRKSNVGDKNI